MSDYIVDAKNISKIFHDGKNKLKILDNINLSIEQGKQIAILGKSGSGKSTLLQILSGLDKPTTGNVIINNENVYKIKEKIANKIRNRYLGFIYQFHHLLPEFTALENIAMPLIIKGEDYTKSLETASILLEEVGLSDRAQHKPTQLSGGERQRIAIARALVMNPKCIFADEPTGNLDSENAHKAFDILQRLNKKNNMSLVVVTHDLELAKKMEIIYKLEDNKLLNC